MQEPDVARLVIARLDGDRIGSDFDRYRALVREGIGGFIVFGGKAREIRDGLRELRNEAGRPLLVASDLEQGVGQQISGGTIFPTALGIGSAFDPDDQRDRALLREAAGVVAREALITGINVVLAPVADVATNPDNPVIGYRSFGDDASRVARLAALWVEGLERPTGLPPGMRGPWACAKHFPGHGDTTRDSHLELPAVPHAADRLRAVELLPFRKAIGAGVATVMIGHLRVEALDPDLPASVSPTVIEGVLRGELGFNGVVMTDALNMGGITRVMSEEEAGVRALLAGTDILLHPSEPLRFLEGLRSRAGEIEPSVARSLARIGRLAADLPEGIGEAADQTGLSGPIGEAQHRAVADRVAARVVRTSGPPVVLEGSEICLVLDDDGEEGTAADLIEELSRDYGCLDLRILRPGGFGDPGDIAGKTVAVKVFSRVRGWKGRSGLREETADFIRYLGENADVRTVAIFGMPELARHFPKTRSRVFAYGTDAAVQRRVARILAGREDSGS